MQVALFELFSSFYVWLILLAIILGGQYMMPIMEQARGTQWQALEQYAQYVNEDRGGDDEEQGGASSHIADQPKDSIHRVERRKARSPPAVAVAEDLGLDVRGPLNDIYIRPAEHKDSVDDEERSTATTLPAVAMAEDVGRDARRPWNADGPTVVQHRNEQRISDPIALVGAARSEADTTSPEIQQASEAHTLNPSVMNADEHAAEARWGLEAVEMSAEERAAAEQAAEEAVQAKVAAKAAAAAAAAAEVARIQADPTASAEAALEQIKEAMRANKTRVLDLFRTLDVDGSGSIDAAEFRKCLPDIGFDVSYSAGLDSLFATLDADGSGTLAYRELNKLLRVGLVEKR